MTTSRDGLRVACPEGFVRRAASPHLVFVQQGRLRTPMRISVWLADDAPTLPGAQTHELASGRASFIREVSEGGSGGQVHVLRAYRPAGAGAIVLEAEVQQEFGEPDFGPAWAVLAEAELTQSDE